MLSRDDIVKFLCDNKEYISQNFHVTKIGLIGSFARNEANENSDIDILIELEEGIPDIFEVKLKLKEFIKKNLMREVDICREKYLKSIVRDEIINEAMYV